jgi:HEAT repeat protein
MFVPLLQGAEDKSTLTPEQDKRVEQLIKQLGAEDFADRENAEKALREFGFPIFKRLRKACDGDDSEVRQRARKIIGDYDGIMALLDKLPQDWHSTLYYEGLTDTQAKITEFGDIVVPYIADRIAHEKEGLYRFNCVTILNTIQTPAAIACLRKLLKDDNAWCRVESVWSLGNASDAESLAQMVELTRDADENVRKEALVAIGKISKIRLFRLGPSTVYEMSSIEKITPEGFSELERVVKYYLENKKLPDAEEVKPPEPVGGVIVLSNVPLEFTSEKMKGDWKAKTFSASNGGERWIVVRYDTDWKPKEP